MHVADHLIAVAIAAGLACELLWSLLAPSFYPAAAGVPADRWLCWVRIHDDILSDNRGYIEVELAVTRPTPQP